MGVWFISNACAYALSGTLGALLPPTGDKYVAAEKLGINLQQVLDGTTQLTTAQLSTLHEAKIAAVYPQIAGITIHNLYEFFMMFVVLCGVAAVLLMAITPTLKKMMHGIR